MSKVIVITGGSEGLGKAIAKRLIKDNKIIIISNNEEKLKKTATEIQCDYVVCDVTNYKQIENAIDTILKKYINSGLAHPAFQVFVPPLRSCVR